MGSWTLKIKAIGLNAATSGTWAAEKAYVRGDTVTIGGQSYVCTSDGTSGKDAPVSPGSDGSASWSYAPQKAGADPVVVPADLKEAAEEFVVGLLTAGHAIQSATLNHEGVDFSLSDSASNPGGKGKNLPPEGEAVEGEAVAWEPESKYAKGDRVDVDGVTYVATVAGTSGANPPAGPGSDGSATWAKAQPVEPKESAAPAWTPQTDYKKGDKVAIHGVLHVATRSGTSDADEPTGSTDGSVSWEKAPKLTKAETKAKAKAESESWR